MSEPNERQGMPLPSWPGYPPPAGDPSPYQYPPGSYPPPGYPPASFPQPGYPPASYPQPGYPQPGYPQPGYSPGSYPAAGYPQPGYPQPGYPPFPVPPRLVPDGPIYDARALPIDDETLARRIAAGTSGVRPSHLFIGAAVVLLAIATILGVFLYQGSVNRARAADAARFASVFCVDEELGNYSDVYQLFSTNMRATISEGDFIAISTLRQRVNGVVGDCAAATDTSSANAGAFSGQFVTLIMQIKLNDGPHSGTLLLIRQDNTWKIEHMDDGLRLLDTLPLATPTPLPVASPSPTPVSGP
jgi:hypothetical protein